MDYGKKLGHKPITIARRLSTIKSFYKFLVNELDYPIDVAARIKLPKVYIPLHEILTETELKNLLKKSAQIDSLYHLLFSMLYYTGSRLTPGRTLEWKNIMMKEKMIYFPRVKGGRDLYLPIHCKLMSLIEQYDEHSFIRNSGYVFSSRKFPAQPVSAADVRINLAREAGIKKS